MWVLESDGDVLQYKRIWLRPDRTYLFGRTTPTGSDVGFVIRDRSVSRKHLTLTVGKVPAGACGRLDIRSELTVRDENTKVGTEVDGERLTDKYQTLSGDRHTLRLGSYSEAFHISWFPVVLSFTFPSKDTKNGKDPLIKIRSNLEDLDIKTIIPYVVGHTTHVVAGKRNTAKCLQALINGIYIVDDSFMNAITYAATRKNLDQPESLSLLETDFDQHWPKAENYLPSPGKEPIHRAPELFTPDLARQTLFKGYTFVFFDEKQYENLLPPIENAGGKARFCAIAIGQSTAAEIADIVVQAAREAEASAPGQSLGRPGVAYVSCFGENAQWASETWPNVARLTRQQPVEQNSLLDIILGREPQRLRRAPEGLESNNSDVDDSLRSNGTAHSDAAQPRGMLSSQAVQTQPPAVIQSSFGTQRTRARGTVTRAFRGFDDGYEPSTTALVSSSWVPSSRGNGMIVESVADPEERPAVSDGPASSDSGVEADFRRKRLRSEVDEDQTMEDQLLPAAAEMKRRKIAAEQDAANGQKHQSMRSRGRSRSSEAGAGEPEVKNELDVKEVIRKRREAEDAAAREDQESLRRILDNMTAEGMQNLAVVEEMDVPERASDKQHMQRQNSRWDPRWDGRRNFKKFRRQGTGPGPRRGQTVMVALKEVVGPERPFSDEYFLTSNRRRKEKAPAPRVQASPNTTFTSATSHQDADEEEVPASLRRSGEPTTIDVEAPRSTRLRDKALLEEQSSQRPFQARSSKRAAPASQNGPPTKRAHVYDDSDSDDGMTFRFRAP